MRFSYLSFPFSSTSPGEKKNVPQNHIDVEIYRKGEKKGDSKGNA